MLRYNHRNLLYITAFIIIGLLFCLPVNLFAARTAVLDKTVFLPDDKMETILHIGEKGWYRVQTQSPTGTEIALLDRMSGVLAMDGRKGAIDGKVSLLLEEGEYKIRLTPDNNEDNKVELTVQRFSELNGKGDAASLPFINDGDFFTAALHDQETRSYWVYMEEKAPLHLEVMGRNLIACRLWLEGEWILPENSSRSTYEPVQGRPMAYYEFYEVLEPGYYLLQCIGGSPMAWTNDAGEYPLYIRRGVEYLGQFNYREHVVSPFGTDYYWISGKTSYVQLSREDIKETSLGYGTYYTGRRRSYSNRTEQITKSSKNPWCSLSISTGNEKKWLVVRGEPGDKVKLLLFIKQTRYSFRQEDNLKKFWISGISSIENRYSLDLTPLLWIRSEKNSIAEGNPVRIGPGNTYIRRINLFQTLVCYCYIEENGLYKVQEEADEDGGKGQYKLSLLGDSESYYNVPYLKPGDPILLQKGYYQLEIRPEKFGILHFGIYNDKDKAAINAQMARAAGIPVHSFVWSGIKVDIKEKESASLQLNDIPNTSTGLQIRALPLDLAEPVLFSLEPGQQVEIPVVVTARSMLKMAGNNYWLTNGQTQLGTEDILAPGQYSLFMKNTGTDQENYSLATVPLTEKRTVLPAQWKQVFPVLTAGQALFADYDRQEQKQFLVQVKEPALYKVETTGRLSMGLIIRTRLKPNLFSTSSNGTGSNALVETYLQPGDYLVQARTIGQSKGRAGLALQNTPLTDGGILVKDAIFRNTVESDNALRFLLTADKEALYQIETMGLGNAFHYRFEEEEGWPLVTNSSGTLKIRLQPGKYYYYSLPLSFKTRRLTRLQLPELSGSQDNPYLLPINERRKNTWMEKEGRPPDVYTLTVPARLNLSFYLSTGMVGELVELPDTEIVELQAGNTLQECRPGKYIVKVYTPEANNAFSYEIGVTTRELAPGLSHTVSSFPASLVISNPAEQNINLWSLGSLDVKASLWDRTGTRLLAENDDLANDWNFQITHHLVADTYQLRIDRIGTNWGSILVFMDAMDEVLLPVQKLPFAVTQTIKQGVVRIPFTSGADTGLYSFTAESGVPVSLSLYRGSRLLAVRTGSLAIPLEAGTKYFLHLEHQETNPVQVKLTANLPVPDKFTFRGTDTELMIGQGMLIDNAKAVSFFLTGNTDNLLYAPGREKPCLPVSYLPLNTVQKQGWLFNSSPVERAAITIKPVALEKETAVPLVLEAYEHSFTLSHYAGEVLLVKAEAPGSRLGLMIEEESRYSKTFFSWDNTLVTPDASYAGVPGTGEFRGKVWNPAGSGREIPAALSVQAFPTQQKEALTPGSRRQVVLAPGHAYCFTLQGTTQELNLLLSAGLVAFAWNKGVPEGIVAAPENSVQKLIVSGGILALVNTGKQEQLARVESVRTTVPLLVEVTGTADYEEVMEKAGTLRLKIIPGAGMDALCVSGSAFTAELAGTDGRIYKGEPLPAAFAREIYPLHAGSLEIHYQPGFLSVIQCTKQNAESAFVRFTAGLKAGKLEQPAVLENRQQLWAFSQDAPGFIRLECTEPGVTALYADKRLLAVTAAGADSDRTLFYFAEKGNYRVFTRPLDRKEQQGQLSLSRFPLVDLDGEGSGAPVIIGPGEQHFYSFTVNVAGKIGIGIRAENDTLEGELYDSTFHRIASGPLIFSTLEKGRYYLSVRAEKETVQYSPVVLGTDGTITEIPYEIINQYRK